MKTNSEFVITEGTVTCIKTKEYNIFNRVELKCLIEEELYDFENLQLRKELLTQIVTQLITNSTFEEQIRQEPSANFTKQITTTTCYHNDLRHFIIEEIIWLDVDGLPGQELTYFYIGNSIFNRFYEISSVKDLIGEKIK